MKQLSLTRYELYKLFSRKSIWIFLGLLIVAVYLPLQFAKLSGNHVIEYYQPTPATLIQDQQAKRDLTKVNREFNTPNAIPNQIFFSLLYKQNRDQAIINSASGSALSFTLEKLKHEISSLKLHGEPGYAYRKDSLEYAMTKQLPYIGGGAYYGSGAMIIDYFRTYGLLFFGAMILIGLAPVFSEEYAQGTDSYLLSTKRGKQKVVTAKVLASMLYVAVMEGILLTVSIASNLILYGFKGLNYPLQSIPIYYAPFHLSIGQYIVVAVLIQLFSGIIYGFFVLLVSSFNRFSMVSFFISAGILALPELISKMLPYSQWAQTVLDYSYTGLMQVSRLFERFIAYNLFGYPVLYPDLVIILAILISILVVRLTYLSFSRRESA